MESSALIVAIAGVILITLGPLAGYLFFRYRYGRRISDLEYRESSLHAREVDFNRTRYQASTARIHQSTASGEDTLSLLREEVEQKSLELSIVRQDYELELKTLRQETASLRSEIGHLRGEPVSIQDIDPASGVETPDSSLSSSYTDFEEIDEDESTPDEPAPYEPAPDEPVLDELVQDEPELDEPAPAESVLDEPTLDELVQDEPELDEPDDFEPVPGEDFETESRVFFDISPDTPYSNDNTDPDPIESAPESEDEDWDEDVFRFLYPEGTDGDEPVEIESLSRPSDSSTEATKTDYPTFTPVSFLMPEDSAVTSESHFKSLVRLSDDQYDLLDELGYGSMEKIAKLSSTEVRRLAEIFSIPAQRIESDWIPNAQLILFEKHR